MAIFDWQSLENRLLEQTTQVILRFAAEHPNAKCSFFAFDTDPVYGYFRLCFDTLESSIRVAQQNEQEAIEIREKRLSKEHSWQNASEFLAETPIWDYSSNVGLFAFSNYEDIKFDELNYLFLSDGYPESANNEDDYIEGNVRIMLWRVIERLVGFEPMVFTNITSPFRLGYQLHDEELVVLRIINWPQM